MKPTTHDISVYLSIFNTILLFYCIYSIRTQKDSWNLFSLDENYCKNQLQKPFSKNNYSEKDKCSIFKNLYGAPCKYCSSSSTCIGSSQTCN